MKMTPKKSGIAQPFKNTPIIETDNTLNKHVGRNTKQFCIMALNPKSMPLVETYVSMTGRLIVAADVRIDSFWLSEGFIVNSEM